MTTLVETLPVPQPQDRYDLFVGNQLMTLTVATVGAAMNRRGWRLIVFTNAVALHWDSCTGFRYW